MFINHALQEINFKIVYYGPGLSGKTTNLEFIHNYLHPSMKSELVTLNTREERTLYFDFMQLHLDRINGKKPRFNLYTVPGQVYYRFSRKIILKGVDGIVFVADSQKARMSENLDSLLDLETNLIEMGHTLQTFPWIIQYNKRDLHNVETINVLQTKLNFFRTTHFETVATTGANVLPTLKTMINEIITKIEVLA